MRKYSFSCGATFESPLTVQFSVPFSDTSETTTTTIKVLNLKDTTIDSVQINTPAILNAGYEADYGTIFTGFLKNTETAWSGPDKVTSFICADAPSDYLQKDFSKSYTQNTNASLIIQDITAFAGLKIGDISLPVDFVYRSGKTVKGKPKTLLEGIAKDCKAKMHVTKGLLYMREKDAGTNLGLAISKETGLLDNPERIENEVDDGKEKKKRTGYKLKMLLNPRVDTDVIIQLTSKTVTGTFRVEKGEHKGDSSSQEWFTECEVYPV